MIQAHVQKKSKKVQHLL